jgi:hypothetical protein
MASDTGNHDLEYSVSLKGSNYYDDQIAIHEAEDSEVNMEALDIIPYSYEPEESGDDGGGDGTDTRWRSNSFEPEKRGVQYKCNKVLLPILVTALTCSYFSGLYNIIIAISIR